MEDYALTVCVVCGRPIIGLKASNPRSQHEVAKLPLLGEASMIELEGAAVKHTARGG